VWAVKIEQEIGEEIIKPKEAIGTQVEKWIKATHNSKGKRNWFHIYGFEKRTTG